jgi:hypothetical protein
MVFPSSCFLYSGAALIGSFALCALNEKLENILNLAWDTGAVTTGPVTVPFVLALGVGVARSIGKYEDATAGFGIVALASAFPVLGVLALGMWLNPSTRRHYPKQPFLRGIIARRP